MALRHGRWLWYYQRRSMHWTFGASDGFSMSIGQNSSPMMRYALVRGRHFCPTLFAVVVCSSLAICTAPTPHKTITVLYRLAFWVLLMIGDGGSVVPDNPGWEQWRLTCDQWTSDWRRRSGVFRTDRHGETRDNGYVYDKLLKKKNTVVFYVELATLDLSFYCTCAQNIGLYFVGQFKIMFIYVPSAIITQ